MKNLALLITLVTTIFWGTSISAQKISDGQTLEVNGMNVTFNILNKESIESGGKQYDRYKVSATVKNTSDKAYNIRLSAFPQIVSNINLVELDCINATGARLTSKKIELKMKAQIINVTYSAYDKSGKFTTSTIPVTGSYYFDPGDSISNNAIFIVPQGEKPDVSVRSLR
ncbi:hypothetical protein EG359_07890 [Chryseobacterium joostei]|uniref:Uncharacterized protein n=1 Tax=Chryseobacterium joostei TaxID=112234 RepID=A0A1N7JFB8_9FLAO|nr:hypothetical protein [Chryseobacterium joostei]AZA99534.1 hypothetical protein EG359_07890 [Chryseobacterium joostei]SIS31096.1 hypothetical protein SAMN05421768_102224 [Chryseobacterium joostei]SIS48009.1 hypothetical protein SAMN05421768_108223 [Chryseobacterium joostei]